MRRRIAAGIMALIIMGTIGLGAIFNEATPVNPNQPPEGDSERIAEIMAELRENMGSKYLVEDNE